MNQSSTISVPTLPEDSPLVYFSPEGQRQAPTFPLALAPSDRISAVEPLERRLQLQRWLTENRSWLRSALQEHGAILLRGFGLEGAQDFEETLDSAGFTATPYLGGAAPRERVRGQRILTSNESPPEEPIPFHHEMAQTPNPPAYISFFCEVAPQVGGETPIIYSPAICRRFREICPEFAQRVAELGVCYRRVMPAQDDPNSPIGRSWRSTFLCEEREEAEEKMRAAGMRWRWLEEESLETLSAPTPALRVDPRTGEEVFFNSMVAAYTGWQDERNEATESLVCGDESPVDGAALLKTKAEMELLCAAIAWTKGDLLLIDNGLVMHSRRPFSGPRRILASIAQGIQD
ncbi:MAG: TauD/TfdA family dioxygenase [Myxococcota bacterium]|nr:TauD/TfdA family dioxygenase [Myxococcota bacterium]